MKHYRSSCYDDDWYFRDTPDPYTVVPGYKQLPTYKCGDCRAWKPDVEDRYVFNRETGLYDRKDLCGECWQYLKAAR